jgi:hypothetical protein
MNKHTPTPWETADAYGPIEGGQSIKAVCDNYLICSTTGYYGRDGAIANAAFIVRAVNSHEQLVAALKRCLARIKAECADPEDIDDVAFAESVLTAVEGK